MQSVLWLLTAWVGGTAAILGGLMLLGSLLMWLLPLSATKRSSSKRDRSDSSSPLQAWRQRLLVAVVAVGLAVAGVGLLWAVPFPDHLPV